MKKMGDMITIEQAIRYAIGLIVFIFGLGGTYMMFKFRIDALEMAVQGIREQRYVSKEDFDSRIRSLEWRLNRSR